jgi:hypothetical protein
MAHAPTPGVSDRAEAATAAKRIVVVRLVRTDQTYRLAAANLPVDQRAVVLKQVGVSYDTILTSGDGLLTTAVFVWLARRAGGERSLSWQQFQRQWPDDIVEDDLDCWAEDPQGRRLDEDGNLADVLISEDEAAELEEGADPQS